MSVLDHRNDHIELDYRNWGKNMTNENEIGDEWKENVEPIEFDNRYSFQKVTMALGILVAGLIAGVVAIGFVG